MTRALFDVIGEDIGEVPCEVGFSLNPGKAIRGIGRSVKRVTRKVKKTIDKVPVVRDIAKAQTQFWNLQATPYRLAGGFIVGGLTGGPKGAFDAAKEQGEVTIREGKRFIQNPAVRYGTKGAAIVFPPLTPVAAGIEAANQAIAAIESKDPVKAAFALSTVANTAAAAAGGDPGAARAIKALKAVRDGTLQAKDYAEEGAKAMKLGARFNIPKGTTALKAAKAADSLLSKAKGKAGKVAATHAQAIIKQTTAAAKAGDKQAKQAATVLAKVNNAQNAKAALLPKKKAVARGLLSVSAAAKAVGKALRPSKGKTFTNAFVVDSKGVVYRGTVTAK